MGVSNDRVTEQPAAAPKRRSPWEVMLSAKPCAVCGANAWYLNRHGLLVCPKHELAHPASGSRPGGDHGEGGDHVDVPHEPVQ